MKHNVDLEMLVSDGHQAEATLGHLFVWCKCFPLIDRSYFSRFCNQAGEINFFHEASYTLQTNELVSLESTKERMFNEAVITFRNKNTHINLGNLRTDIHIQQAYISAGCVFY